MRRLRYLPKGDVMLLGGNRGEDHNQHWKPMGPVLCLYDGWNTGTPKLRRSAVLPYEKGSGGNESTEPISFDIAGDFVFVAYTRGLKADGLKNAFVKVLRLSDLSVVGNLSAEAALGDTGLLDLVESVRALRPRRRRIFSLSGRRLQVQVHRVPMEATDAMNDAITVLLSGDESALHARVRALSERISVVTRGQLEESPELLQNVQVAYGWLPEAQIAEATHLRWLQTMGAGVNGLLTPALRARDLVITNASGIHAEPITEHMFGMLLMHTRRLAEAWERQKTHHWGGYDYGANVGMLAGRTLGVLGVGAIGGHSARVGKAFGMRVLGLRRSGEPHPDVARMYAPDELPAFLSECDVVMNSLPLTDKTRGLLGANEFEALKPGAIIINTGRGATMDTGALMAALQSGHLGAALLDVTDPEPLPADHPLWAMDNVSITPHTSGSHPGYGSRADAIFLDNLRRFLAGEPLRNVVDKNEGY